MEPPPSPQRAATVHASSTPICCRRVAGNVPNSRTQLAARAARATGHAGRARAACASACCAHKPRFPRALAAACCCWLAARAAAAARAARACWQHVLLAARCLLLVVVVKISGLRHSDLENPRLIYKFPRPILAYKNSITAPRSRSATTTPVRSRSVTTTLVRSRTVTNDLPGYDSGPSLGATGTCRTMLGATGCLLLPQPHSSPAIAPFPDDVVALPQLALVDVTSTVIEGHDPARPNDYEDYRREKKKKKEVDAEISRELERRRQEEEEREMRERGNLVSTVLLWLMLIEIYLRG
ncbi:hypothetical protein WN943_009595 [Citrus x changshan-huyou]